MRDGVVRCMAIGLNPAWQKTLGFDHLVPGQVNRSTWKRECGGGKAVNLSRAIKCAGGDVEIVQFVGGDTGDYLCRELDESGVDHISVRTAASTRVCSTLVAAGEVTEIIEPSGGVTESELAALQARVRPELASVGVLGLCGTWPPGVSGSFLAGCVEQVRPHGLILLDAYKGVEPILEAGVDVLKVNCDEIALLGGVADPVDAAQRCLDRYGMSFVLVTAGSKAAYLISREGEWVFELPVVQGVVSPIGAGDCVAGIVMKGLANCLGDAREGAGDAVPIAGGDMVEIVSDALACATASCLTSVPGQFEPEEASLIKRELEVVPL